MFRGLLISKLITPPQILVACHATGNELQKFIFVGNIFAQRTGKKTSCAES